ncbi:hypothetical protein FKM82_001284 [Ascaphus truei]
MPSLLLFLFTVSSLLVNVSVLSNFTTPHCTIIYTPLSQQHLYPSIKTNHTNPLFTPSICSFLLLGISLLILNQDKTPLRSPTPPCHLFLC